MAVFMTIPEVVKYSGLSRVHIENWLNDPVDPLPHVNSGNGRGITKIHVELFDEYAKRKAKEVE